MKVSIGFKLRTGPWGGGNQFGHALANQLRSEGIDVSFDLKDRDLDIILLTEPRGHLKSSAYTDKEILRYLYFQNRNAIVVHRINECDERKGTNTVNPILRRANRCADYTVFVGSWLRPLLEGQGLSPKRWSAILNGSDQTIFNPEGYTPWEGTGPLKLVTHHWSAHHLKGFDIYAQLDGMLGDPAFREQFEFTYVGNLPDRFEFKNSRYVEPKSGLALAAELKQHHVYLTASQFEPGGNHQNEGANCGLPLLYRNSGCLPEYCAGYGVEFGSENFVEKLLEIKAGYSDLVPKMAAYPHTSERTAEAYVALFHDLMAQRDELVADRQLFSRPELLLRATTPTIPLHKIQHKVKQWINR